MARAATAAGLELAQRVAARVARKVAPDAVKWAITMPKAVAMRDVTAGQHRRPRGRAPEPGRVRSSERCAALREVLVKLRHRMRLRRPRGDPVQARRVLQGRMGGAAHALSGGVRALIGDEHENVRLTTA